MSDTNETAKRGRDRGKRGEHSADDRVPAQSRECTPATVESRGDDGS